MVVTTEFLHEANMQRDALGMPDLAPVVIDHPLSTLSDAEIAQRAEQAAAQVVAIWLGKGRGMIEGAYAGLRVLDIGQGIAAPYCAMLLAMHGAEVVKLEPPGGDWSRGLGRRYGDHTAMSAHFNRGKKGIAIDLRSPAGRGVALALATRADIVIEGFRPGVASRLGVGYEALAALNPRLIYVSVSGFGQEGPHIGLPCTDSVAQAFSGLAALNIGSDGGPHRVGAMIVDALTGVYAAQAVGVALYARERRGAGARLELSLTQSAAAILGHKLAEYVLEDGNPQVVNVPTGAHRASDGWVMLALLREADFVRLVTALGAPELAADPRFSSFAARAANSPAIFAALGVIFARVSRRRIGFGCCATPIFSPTGSTASTNGLPTRTSPRPAAPSRSSRATCRRSRCRARRAYRPRPTQPSLRRRVSASMAARSSSGSAMTMRRWPGSSRTKRWCCQERFRPQSAPLPGKQVLRRPHDRR